MEFPVFIGVSGPEWQILTLHHPSSPVSKRLRIYTLYYSIQNCEKGEKQATLEVEIGLCERDLSLNASIIEGLTGA